MTTPHDARLPLPGEEPVRDACSCRPVTNSWAVVSLTLGVVVLPVTVVPLLAGVLGLVAVVLGSVALQQIRSDRGNGAGKAGVGICLGLLGVTSLLAAVAGLGATPPA